MEITRVTLRINEELNKKLEAQKKTTGLSKNTLIVQACKNLVEEFQKKK